MTHTLASSKSTFRIDQPPFLNGMFNRETMGTIRDWDTKHFVLLDTFFAKTAPFSHALCMAQITVPNGLAYTWLHQPWYRWMFDECAPMSMTWLTTVATHADSGTFMQLLRYHCLLWIPGCNRDLRSSKVITRIDKNADSEAVCCTAKEISYVWQAVFVDCEGHVPLVGQPRTGSPSEIPPLPWQASVSGRGFGVGSAVVFKKKQTRHPAEDHFLLCVGVKTP